MTDREYGQLYLTYSQNGSTEELQWVVEWIPSSQNFTPFKIPTTMTLIKQ